MLRHSTPGTDQFIRNELVRVIAVKEDAQFIRGAVASGTPTGLRYLANSSTNRPAANATVNADNVQADLSKLLLCLQNADCPMLAPGWIMTPRVKEYLGTLRVSGILVFPEVAATNTLKGFPIYTTTQIPNNLGVGTNESEIYFGDASEMLLAEAPTFSLDASDVAAYHDGTNVVAAYSLDQTVYRLIVEHDFNVRHDVSVAVLTVLSGAADNLVLCTLHVRPTG